MKMTLKIEKGIVILVDINMEVSQFVGVIHFFNNIKR